MSAPATTSIHTTHRRINSGAEERCEVTIPARDVSPSGHLAITVERHKVYDVTHLPTGYRVPSENRGLQGGFRTKTQARAAMLALDGSGVELEFTADDVALIRAVRDFVRANGAWA